MIFSFVMHALIGFLGTGTFRFTLTGIGIAVGVACATQGTDLLRLYMVKKARIQGVHHTKEKYANPEKKLDKAKQRKKARKETEAKELAERREKSIEARIEEMTVQFKADIPKLYIKNVFIFSGVTLFTAELSRYIGVGMAGL